MPTHKSRFTEVLPPPTPRAKPRKLASMSSISSLSTIFARRRVSNQKAFKTSMSAHDVLPQPTDNNDNITFSSATTLAPSTIITSPTPPIQATAEAQITTPAIPLLQVPTNASTTAINQTECLSDPQHERNITAPNGSRRLEDIAEVATIQEGKAGYLGAPVVANKSSTRRKTMGTTDDLSATNIRQITEAQPVAYWCGRFSALHDRFRNEENLNPNDGQQQWRSFSNSFRRFESKMGRDEKRIRRVFIHLNSLCHTQEARDSLKVFQEEYIKANKDLLPNSSSMIGNGGQAGAGGSGGVWLGSNRNNRMEKGADGGGGVRVFKKFLTRKSMV